MSTVNKRLHGRSLQLARAVWVVLVILTLTIFFASLPAYIDLLHTPCVGLACGYQQLSPEQAATLEGIFKLPLCDLVTTHPRLVSWRALCTSLDALARHRVSRRASPCHILPGFSLSEYLCSVDWLSGEYWHVRDPGRRTMVPLPASLQPIRAPTDQMGRIWVRCIHHLGCYRNCSISAVPGGSFA